MNKSALLVIDVQIGLDDSQYGKRNNPNAEASFDRVNLDGELVDADLFHEVELVCLNGEVEK